MNSTNLTIVVYKEHTSPVVSTEAHSSNPVTGKMKKKESYDLQQVTLVNPARKLFKLVIPAFSAKAGV